MATFTTWTALYNTMLDDLASADFTQKEFRIGSRTFEFRDLDDIREQLDYVKGKADAETNEASGTTGYGIFQFKNGGRG